MENVYNKFDFLCSFVLQLRVRDGQMDGQADGPISKIRNAD